MIYGIMLIVIIFLLGCCCIMQMSNKNKNEDLEQIKKEKLILANDYAKIISSRNEWMSRTMAEFLKAKKKDEKMEMLRKDVEKYKKLYLEETKTKQKEKSEITLNEWTSENKNSGIYKIKIWRNDVDTSRYIDYISVFEEKYFENINSAVEYSKKYIKEHFINPGGFRMVGESLACSDICSWGKTIELKKIEVEK